MEIKTKYEIGQHVWYVYDNNGEVRVYDDYIGEIIIDKNEIIYGLSDAYQELKENEVILYEDKEELYKRICELMEEIKEKEEKEKECEI